MKVSDFAFIINKKKDKISGSTPSNGQFVYSKKLKVWLRWRYLKTEKNIAEQLKFLYRSYLVNVHIQVKVDGFRSNGVEVTYKTAKSKMVDFENKCQEHLPFGWSSMVRRPLSTCKRQNVVLKVSTLEKIAELNFNCVALIMKVNYIGYLAEYWNISFVCQHSLTGLQKMVLLDPAVCSRSITWRPDGRTYGRLTTMRRDIQFDSAEWCKKPTLSL